MPVNKTFLAIIPARGGSKRLPNKNVLSLAGKPLIAWTIDAALNSTYLDTVVVSTEDDRIAAISKQYGADVPFIRPGRLATDTATTFDVIKHALDHYTENGKTFDFTVLLQPTSPLRLSSHIDEAIELQRVKNADAVVSVTEMVHSPLWANTLPEDGSMVDFLKKEVVNKPGQALAPYFQLNGAIYLSKTERLLSNKSFFLKENVYAYRMDRCSSVDIDDEIDFHIAEMLIAKQKIS